MQLQNSNLAVQGSPLSYVRLDRAWLEQILRIEKQSHLLPWSRDAFAAELALHRSLALGIVNGGELVSYFFGHLVVDELHILNLATAKLWRGRGYASSLLAYALGTAVADGARMAYLEVRESNSVAQQLYRKFNFVESGLREKYYSNNGENAVLFERKLSSTDINNLFSQSVLPRA